MTKINNVHDQLEKNSIKLEYSSALLFSLRDSFDEVAAAANLKENKEYYTFYEFNRVQKRTEALLNLLDELLTDSGELNYQAIKQLTELKHEVAE